MSPLAETVHNRLLEHPRAFQLARRTALFGRHLARRPHEADFRLFALFPERTGLFLDVGGNAGMSAMAFRLYNKRSPILSIEPNPLHETDLKLVRRLVKGFDFRLEAAGDEPGTLTLHTPVYRGIPFTGEASLSRAMVDQRVPHLIEELGLSGGADGFDVVETTVPVRVLDDLRLAPDFLKLDVQGWEEPVLRGLATTLERHRPVIMVERGDNLPGITAILTPLGYTAHVYDAARHELVADVDRGGLNVAFLPQAARARS